MAVDYSTLAFTNAMIVVVERQGRDYLYPDAERNEYNTCVYVNESGEPSCLIGKVLAELGVSADEISAHEGEPAEVVLAQLGWTSHDLRDAAQAAQTVQDGYNAVIADKSWGCALETYLGKLKAFNA